MASPRAVLLILVLVGLTGCSTKSSALPASPTGDAGEVDAGSQVEAGVVDVPAGTFTMGCNSAVDTSCNDDEKPAHKVTLHAFTLDRLETTQAEYAGCIAAGACTAPTREFDPSGHASFPVAWITWDQANAYCAFRGKRLPTEAEWEWAARGADGRLYPWGNDAPSCARASFSASAGKDSANPAGACRATSDAVKTDAVGSHPTSPSATGAFDMAGNLWEWVNDFYDPAYYATSPAVDPPGPATAPQHAKRGGSWQDSADRLRASRRWTHPQRSGAEDIGVRCAK